MPHALGPRRLRRFEAIKLLPNIFLFFSFVFISTDRRSATTCVTAFRSNASLPLSLAHSLFGLDFLLWPLLSAPLKALEKIFKRVRNKFLNGLIYL